MPEPMKLRYPNLLWTLLLAVNATAQPTLPAPLADGTPSTVPVTVQILRWNMLDSGVNALTFTSMDQLFDTRTVPHGSRVWQLPRNDQPLNLTYAWRSERFTAEEFLERTYTNALPVMKNGRIVSEIYRNNTNEHTRFIGWSMTKSITSVLIGCALEDGLIDSLDTPIGDYLPELESGGYDGVSIRQVMQMRSGVEYPERYDFENPGIAASNHIASLIRNNARFADIARQIVRVNVPGEVFEYKTLDTAVPGWLVERATGRTVASYTTECLWEPLGAESDGYYILDGPPGIGREFNGAGFNATLRDLARFGQMMLNGGVADGRRIVSEQWVQDSTRPNTPGPQGRRGAYALQWWTTGQELAHSAIGLRGQFVYIDPATETVVVKLSYFPPGFNGDLEGESNAFFAAVSAWNPD